MMTNVVANEEGKKQNLEQPSEVVSEVKSIQDVRAIEETCRLLGTYSCNHMVESSGINLKNTNLKNSNREEKAVTCNVFVFMSSISAF